MRFNQYTTFNIKIQQSIPKSGAEKLFNSLNHVLQYPQVLDVIEKGAYKRLP